MIALCTGIPEFSEAGEQTVVTFPSGDRGSVAIALDRNQLCYLFQHARLAMHESFAAPQADIAEIVPMQAGKGAGQ